MSTPLRIYIGYDISETVAYHVLCQSILERSSIPVTFLPLASRNLRKFFDRPRDPLQSNDFSFTRFLVPYLSDYKGISVYMDCDMLMLDDVDNLLTEVRRLNHEPWAVACVQHEHHPRTTKKYLSRPQTAYPKKNWSSFMVFNNAHCMALTPDYVENATGLQLHQFKWCDDSMVKPLPQRWNHLVDYTPQTQVKNISVLHYTEGGPWFNDYRDCGYANIWLREYNKTIYCQQQSDDVYPELKRFKEEVE
jgi:hypothetical protein